MNHVVVPHNVPTLRWLLPGVLALSVLVVFISCATAPKVPDWVRANPPPDGTNTYFVGQASGKDPASASNDATADLIARIMQYIGVTVKVSSSATAKATMDAYSAEIRQTVETQSSNRLSGFQVKQKYIRTDSKTGIVTVYILASYATSDLNREKKRIQDLFQEKIDAVARPEAEGDELAAAGNPLRAAIKYIEAMAAASGSEVENADIKLERNAKKAREQIARISLTIEPEGTISGMVGVPGPLVTIRLLSDKNLNAVPISDAMILLSYPRKLASGRIGSKTETLTTDSRGLAHLQLPLADFVGKGSISAQLDLSSALAMLDRLPARFEAMRSAIEDELAARASFVSYAVQSNSRNFPTAVAILETNERGIPTGTSFAQNGILETLSREGYSLQALSIPPEFFASDQLVLDSVRKAAKPGTVRVIFGTVRIDTVRIENNMFIASASGQISVVDLAGSQTLFRASKTWQAIGTTETSARQNALQELGSKVFAPELLLF